MQLRYASLLLAIALAYCATPTTPAAGGPSLLRWPDTGLPPGLQPHDSVVTRVQDQAQGEVLAIDFAPGPWPNLWLTRPEGQAWDWSAYSGLGFLLYNPADHPITVMMRVDNAGADGSAHCQRAHTLLPAKAWTRFEARFRAGDSPFWGMRGSPEPTPALEGPPLELSAIVACQIFLPNIAEPERLLLADAYLLAHTDTPTVALPLVDAFGQNRHADWPGKLREETALLARRDAEAAELATTPQLTERDAYGGWTAGPQREATGWFRAEKVDGKWWLVTPVGHLFLSIGMNCVNQADDTFVEARAPWFEWLPAEDDPYFGRFYGQQSGAHSMAEPIGGAGRTFNFYRTNLVRKYGENYAAAWRDAALARLPAWGFNTIANWSDGQVIAVQQMPYVVSTAIGGVPEIAGASGYWGPMIDVYDPAFATAVDRAIGGMTMLHRERPMCLGYFVDNERAWEGVAEGALRSPPDQPARVACIAMLQETYETLDALNTAWGTEATAWDSLHPNDSAACRADLDAFLYRFARRYFDTIAEALRRHAPNQLYLGCRFSTAPEAAVRAAAEVADVLSFNLYQRAIDCGEWRAKHPYDKPVLVGEFHFGALDRGLLHTGLVPTANQAERAAAYADYWRAVAQCPNFVGAHWFQYVDEPLTGRWYDGENYNIGFVDVTDTPYPELVDAARGIHAEVYRLRHGTP